MVLSVLSTELFGSIPPPRALTEALECCGSEHAALDTLYGPPIEGRTAGHYIAKVEAISEAVGADRAAQVLGEH